ncbi:indolepyruvate ferredoxin oxidoreductase subunit alpha [Ilyobacter sp.]|jgi:ferredoxin|uniref:indolepyruvate ferredoxin oxidoreductase subunit alpha n=1 Tax=Ilyobacter sp. TaxID=3100343 RepID=UPI0035664437
MAYRIKQDECIACGACEPVCPVSCISEVVDGKREIDESACIDCGACAGVCPVECIASVE